MTNWNRNSRRPGRRPLAASILLHVGFVLVGWWAHEVAHEPIEYIAYEMQMVSLADLEELEEVAPQTEDVVVETPDDPEPPDLEPDPEPEPTLPDPEPDPEPEPSEPEPAEPEPTPEPDEPEPEPTPTPEEPQEDVSAVDMAVRMEGLQRDFPAYYRMIQTEILRCFRPPAGVDRATAVLRFVIQQDGTVPGASIRLHERSGNSRFDIAAVGAVECAGGRFGPLPDELPYDELPVQFTFSPAGSGRGGS